MKKIKIIKSDNRRKVNGKWEQVPFDEWTTVVDVVEAKSRTEAFNKFVENLGDTWEIDRNYLTATRSNYKKRRRSEQYTFEEVQNEY